MSPNLDKKLIKDFPILFQDRYGSMRETAMCWGFECGDGWEPIIRELAIFIEDINKSALPEDQAIVATQVKEKYGALCFYVDFVPEVWADAVYAAIDEAEKKSEVTCERCGRKGKLRGRGWYYTACGYHTRKEDR